MRESRHQRDKISDKNSRKRIFFMGVSEIFFSKVARASCFQWGIFIFLAAEKLAFGGPGITSKLAS